MSHKIDKISNVTRERDLLKYLTFIDAGIVHHYIAYK